MLIDDEADLSLIKNIFLLAALEMIMSLLLFNSMWKSWQNAGLALSLFGSSKTLGKGRIAVQQVACSLGVLVLFFKAADTVPEIEFYR